MYYIKAFFLFFDFFFSLFFLTFSSDSYINANRPVDAQEKEKMKKNKFPQQDSNLRPSDERN